MKKILAAFIVLAAHVPANSHATTTCTSQVVTIVAGNQSTDTAHLIYLANSNTCSGLCTGTRAYIEFSDKALFAQALAAKVNNTVVNI